MASEERNALAELAEQVKRERNALAFYRSEYSPVLDKAQRIIAELAKVDTVSDLVGMIGKCRVIAAEEGANDER